MVMFKSRIMALEVNAASHNPVLFRDCLYINFFYSSFAVNMIVIVFNVGGVYPPRMIGKE